MNKHIDFPIVEFNENKFQVNVNINLYAKETIIASCYKFSHLYYIYQVEDEKDSKIIHVIFESKDDKQIVEADVKQFCNELLDQQIRYNVNLQFGNIRDLIVKEAFKPISK